jgi:ATP-dependent Clp protease ATP-binding subunit ClpB
MEKEAIQKIRDVKNSIDLAKLEEEKAEREGNLQRVAEIRYGELNKLHKALEEANIGLNQIQKYQKMLKEEVTDEDISEIISRWTGIPLQRLIESEKQKLNLMEERLAKRVIGQEEAIESVSNAVRRSRAGLQDKNKPMGSFIFMGSTGVGKTELAKALAEFLFDDEQAIIRLDMSEYMEKHSVSRLVGAPPGYVGYDEGGQLTEAVRRRPYAVILLDEIEKAHPDVFNILLQILDDGHITDSKGRKVNFKNTLIIMTSNIGSQFLLENYPYEDTIKQSMLIDKLKDELILQLKKVMRPEFINRIDEIIMFEPLSIKQIKAIIEIQLEILVKKLTEQDWSIRITESAKEYIVKMGYDAAFGARPIKRSIQKYIVNPLSKLLLNGNVSAKKEILVDCFNNDIIVKIV